MAGQKNQTKQGSGRKRGRKAKAKGPPPLSDLDKARLTREKATTTQFGNLHPSISVLYLPWHETADGKLVMFIYPNNHNTVEPKKVIEIMNNIADNPMQILNTQPRDWGTDEWYNWYHHDRDQNIEKLPMNEKIQLVAVAKAYSGECPWVAIARPHGEMKPDWFNEVLNSGGMQHLKLNAWTDAGIDQVVRDNGWGNLWGQFKKRHTAETLMSDKYTDLLRCSARRNNKWKIRGSPKEGLHRTYSAACIATKSPPNAFTATLNPGQLKVADFLKGGLIPRCKVDDKIISTAAENAIIKENPMLDDSLVKMSWLANYDVPAGELFAADRVESDGVAQAKMNVALPNAGDYIGIKLADIMRDIPADSILMTPKFDNFPKFYHHVRVSDKEATEKATAGEEYEESEMFEDEAIDAYIRDPITKSNYKPARDALSFPTTGTTTGKLMLAPHPVSYRSMVREEAFDGGDEGTKSFSMTCETANAILVVPVIVAHLLASLNNQSPREAIKGSNYQHIVLYVLNFHLCTKSGYPTNNTVHGCMRAQYGLHTTSKANVIQPLDGLIGAIMYIFHTWTATVMDACDTDGTTEKKRANLRRNADMFEGAMKSMEVGRLKTDAKGVVMTLAQIQSILSSLSKEYINKVKSGPYKLKEMNNQGLVCMTFLHKLVYLLKCNEVMKVIQMHGLFPQPSDLLPSMSPDLYSIYKLKIRECRDADLKEEVTKIFDAMGRNKFIKIQNHITRIICKTTNTHDVENSLLSYYLVMMSCHFAENYLQYHGPANGIPMFVKGSIIGPTKTASDTNHPLNNLILRSENGKDDDWDECKVQSLADLRAEDYDSHGIILSIPIAAKGCFRTINDTLTNTEDHNKHIDLLSQFALPLGHSKHMILLEMNREMKEERKKKTKNKGRQGNEDDEVETEDNNGSGSPATPGAAGPSASNELTGGSEAATASDASGIRRSTRRRRRPDRSSDGNYKKNYDEGGSEDEDDDDSSNTSVVGRTKLVYTKGDVSSPSKSSIALQATAFADFMKVLGGNPAYKELSEPVVKYFRFTFGDLTPMKKAAPSFAEMEKAALNLTKEQDETERSIGRGAGVKIYTQKEIIQKFQQINFQHKNPTSLSSQPGIGTINATLGIKAAGMVRPHSIRYKDQFVFIEMSNELCRSIWSREHRENGKPMNEIASIIYDALLDYSSGGWKVSLFVNSKEPMSDLVVLVTDSTYNHLKNNKLAEVYKKDGGSSGSEEGSDDGKDDEDESDEKQKEDGNGEKGESNDGGDELMEEDEEDGTTGEAPKDMQVNKNDEADGGKQTGPPRGGVSGAAQADVTTTQNQSEPRGDNDATTANTPRKEQPGDDVRGELGAVDEVTSPNANEIEEENHSTGPNDGEDEGDIDGSQVQSQASDGKGSVESSDALQAPEPEEDNNERGTTSKSAKTAEDNNNKRKISPKKSPDTRQSPTRKAKKRVRQY